MQRLFAAERQQLARESRGAIRRFANFFEVLADGFVRPNLFEDHLGIADDGRQQVVEVMRDSARQPSDAFQLLRLP